MLRSKLQWKLFAAHGLVLVLALALANGLTPPQGRASWMLALAASAGLCGSWIVTWRFTRSLRKMADAAKTIAAGDASTQRVPEPADDERGLIAQALNTMGENLRQSMEITNADRGKLTAILSSMVEGLVAVDHDERIVHMNQVAGRLFEVDPDEVLSRPIWEITRIREVTEILTATLRSKTMEHRVARLPGPTDRFLDLHSSPLRAGGGGTVGAVMVVHDITQIRHLEAIRRDFIGNVSHELKTPVTAIRGIVETLIDDPEIEAEIRQRFLGKISRQAERMSSIVTDLLSLSRLESPETPLKLCPLDVREVVEESMRSLQPASEARRVSIRSDWPNRPFMVDGEEESLRQAVGNLLSNAVKYSPPESCVTVSVRQRDGVRQQDSDVLIEVKDQGPGIEPRHHARIFERFYRVDAARSRELGGTGLGLAIVKHTALALGGDVAVESVTGEGSTFSIRLPMSFEAETWEAIRAQDIRDLIA